MRLLLLILTVLGFYTGCKTKGNEQHLRENNSIPGIIPTKQSIISINTDSIKFYRAVKALEEIHFFISGKDSVTTNKFNLNKLPELAFARQDGFVEMIVGQTPTRDTAPQSYPEYCRKYMLQLRDGKKGTRPRAAVIQFSFNKKENAADWFKTISEQNEDVIMIKGIKPKTWMWRDSSKVYMVQTYYTPEYHYVNLLRDSLISELKK